MSYIAKRLVQISESPSSEWRQENPDIVEKEEGNNRIFAIRTSKKGTQLTNFELTLRTRYQNEQSSGWKEQTIYHDLTRNKTTGIVIIKPDNQEEEFNPTTLDANQTFNSIHNFYMKFQQLEKK